MTFDSEEYWGLDEEVIGETSGNAAGTVDESTRPISEAVERRMDANNQFLKSRDWKMCFPALRVQEDDKTTEGSTNLINNDRRLSSLFSIFGKAFFDDDQMGQFLFSLPVYIYPDTTKFRVTMKGYVLCPREERAGDKPDGPIISEPDNDLGKSVRVNAYLSGTWNPIPPVPETDGGGDFFGQSRETWTTADNPVHRIEIDVNKRDIQKWQPATLLLEFHTNPERQSESVSIASVNDLDLAQVEKWKQHIINLSNSNNDLAAVESMQQEITDDTFIRVTDAALNSPAFRVTRTSLDDHKINVALRSSNEPSVNYGDQSLEPTVSVHYINSIAPQSWAFECFSDKTTPAREYVPKTNQEMEANQVVSGSDIEDHATNMDYSYRKPRLKAIGPDGGLGFVLGAEVPWAQGYNNTTNSRWTSVLFSDASNSGYTSASQIDRHSFRADKGKATYRVITHYVPVSYWKVSGTVDQKGLVASGGQSNDGHYGMSIGSTPNIEDVTLEAGVDIDFGYEIRQRGSSATNEVVASNVETEQDKTIFIGNIRNRFPLLRTVYEWFWTDPDGEDFTYAGDEENSNPNLVYREGWLDRMDIWQLMQTSVHDIELPAPSDSTVDHDRPFQLLQYLHDTSNVTAEWTDRDGNTFTHPDTKITMVVLQTAVYEVPA